MSKKIEDVFGMASASDLADQNDIEDTPPMVEDDAVEFDISQMQLTLDTADKIDKALPAVTDMGALDIEMDSYAEEAMGAFKDLMDLGQNVEDRHAANIFAVAGTMMTNAINAKTTKMDKKLKIIEMQMRKRKLDLEEKKVDMQIAKMQDGDSGDDSLDGTAKEFDRSDLISDIMKKIQDDK